LTPEDFDQQQQSSNPAIRAKMSKFDFYVVCATVNLSLESGYSLTNLECILEFCPDEANIQQKPMIFDLFPKTENKEIFSLSSHLTLGLDENLLFSAQTSHINEESTDIIPISQAKLTAQFKSGVSFQVSPLNYKLYRSITKATGKSDIKASWQFTGKEAFLDGEVILCVILTIPKSRLKPINARGSITAYHQFQWLTADIPQDIVKKLKTPLKNPIISQREFINITNKLSFVNLHPQVRNLHHPETGNIDYTKMAKLLGFSSEKMAKMLNCNLDDLSNENDELQSKILEIYLIIGQIFDIDPSIDEHEFKIVLVKPLSLFLENYSNRENLRQFLLRGEFETLKEIIPKIGDKLSH
jgi:hypothetical protein